MKRKPKLWLFESKKRKPKPRCFPAVINTLLYPWLLAVYWNSGKIYRETWFWKWKMLSCSSFETRNNQNMYFWIWEVTKPNLKPKPLTSHKTEAEALSFWHHEAEALASNSKSKAASYLCLRDCHGQSHGLRSKLFNGVSSRRLPLLTSWRFIVL